MARRRRPLILEEKVDRRLDRLSSSRGQANARPLASKSGGGNVRPAPGGNQVQFGYDFMIVP